MKWVNVIGLLLQFISFWFAAPELLGSETLKRFEKGITHFLSLFPSIALGLLGMLLGLTMSAYGIYKGATSSSGNAESSPLLTIIPILAISVLYILYMVFFYKKLQRWIEKIFAKPLILALIHDNQSRKLALIVGAFLFTTGFLCQFVVAVLS